MLFPKIVFPMGIRDLREGIDLTLPSEILVSISDDTKNDKFFCYKSLGIIR